jgi:hypothetical protein
MNKMSKGLENLNPKFWYINEQGEVSKYIYCKLCHAGPFKESEKKISFNFYGQGNKDPYCMPCASALKFFQSSVSPKNHKKPEALDEDYKNLRSKEVSTEESQEPDIPD